MKHSRPILIGCLSLLGLFLVFAVLVSNFTTKERPRDSSPLSGNTGSKAPVPPVAPVSKPLALLASSGERGEYGWNTVEGQVQNLSAESLSNVEAVAIWYTSDGQFISSDSALIEYNPLLPGQKSPFKVMARANPAMKRYAVEFKTLFGVSLDCEDRRKGK